MRRLIIIFFLGFFAQLSAQTKIEKSLQLYQQEFPQEKVHIELQKEKFIAGEKIWFKAYVFDGYELSRVSTNLYVELYDGKKSLIAKKMLPLINAETSGNLQIPEDAAENVYYLRAYTTWMTNFSSEFQFLKLIPIVNPNSSEKLKVKEASEWRATIHPEGGSLIAGNSSKFAVRLISDGALPSGLKGFVAEVSNPNEKIADYTSYDRNTGFFSFMPLKDKKYHLVLQDTNGNKKSFDIPVAEAQGVSLQVSSTDKEIKYRLKSSKPLSESQYFTVLGTMNTQLVYKAVLKNTGLQQHSIATDKLVNGVLQLTVLDDKENIEAQRLCFVQPKNLEIKRVKISSQNLNLDARGKNSFAVSSDSKYQNLNIAVVDYVPSLEDNILSALWLTGDFGSRIDVPAQYFASNANVDALDALLITEKWKRIDWQALKNDKFPNIKNQPESYLSYKGQLIVEGKPAADTNLSLTFHLKNHGTRIIDTKTDKKGLFVLNTLAFEDTVKFTYQIENKSIPRNQVSAYLQPNFGFKSFTGTWPPNSYELVKRTSNESSAEEQRLVDNRKNQKEFDEKVFEIEEVKLKATKKDLTKKLNKELSSVLFRGINEDVFDFVNDHAGAVSNDIISWLQGRSAGLSVMREGGDYSLTYRGSRIPVFLDEMEVSPSTAASISMADVAMVKVIKGTFAGGRGVGNGAVVIYTKKGSYTETSSNQPKPRQVSLQGYEKEDYFNSPSYDISTYNSINKDVRNVLFWNPDLEVAAQTPTEVKFFNNDNPGLRYLKVTGFDNEIGIPVYSVIELK